MSEKQEIKVNESIKVICKVHIDDHYEPDYYGSFGNEAREWCIDRRWGVLLGEAVDEPEYPDLPCITDEEYDRVENGWKYYHSREMYLNNLDSFWRKTKEQAKVYEEYNKKYDEWEKYHGLKVLSDDVYTSYRYSPGRDCRFYYPLIENYQATKDYTPTLEEQIKWCLEDHKRLEGLDEGSWCYLGYEVEVWVEGIEVASESLWGIESDMERHDKEEVWKDLLDECFSNIEKKISDMVNALQMGFSALPSKETIADLVKEIE